VLRRLRPASDGAIEALDGSPEKGESPHVSENLIAFVGGGFAKTVHELVREESRQFVMEPERSRCEVTRLLDRLLSVGIEKILGLMILLRPGVARLVDGRFRADVVCGGHALHAPDAGVGGRLAARATAAATSSASKLIDRPLKR